MGRSEHPLRAWRQVNHAGYTLATHRHDVLWRRHNGFPPTTIDADLDSRLREQMRAALELARSC
jgi:hypothetical protein